jgi:ABC-type Zn uptake system ZnuABC Zn-binding protein ZnuA
MTPAALETLSRAEILVSGGLGLDSFLARALGVAKPGLKIIDAAGGGLTVSPENNQSLVLSLAEARNWYGTPEPQRPDPHLFASITGAMAMTANIAEGLGRLDPQGAQLYRSTANEISAGFQKLLFEFQAVAARWSPKPRVVLSHGSLSYLAADLGLTVEDVIDASGEASVSAARLGDLVNKAKDCAAVLADPEGQLNLARTVGAGARRPVAVIDPVSSGPPDPPADYFQKVLQTNLAVLDRLFTAQAASEKAEAVESRPNTPPDVKAQPAVKTPSAAPPPPAQKNEAGQSRPNTPPAAKAPPAAKKPSAPPPIQKNETREERPKTPQAPLPPSAQKKK